MGTVFPLWAYTMKVIPEMHSAHCIVYLHMYYYIWVDTCAGGLLVPEGIIRPVVSLLALIWFMIYICSEIYS